MVMSQKLTENRTHATKGFVIQMKTLTNHSHFNLFSSQYFYHYNSKLSLCLSGKIDSFLRNNCLVAAFLIGSHYQTSLPIFYSWTPNSCLLTELHN